MEGGKKTQAVIWIMEITEEDQFYVFFFKLLFFKSCFSQKIVNLTIVVHLFLGDSDEEKQCKVSFASWN